MNLPNVPRNLIAHELGHAIGLGHNADPLMLMCGPPRAVPAGRLSIARAALVSAHRRGEAPAAADVPGRLEA